MTNAAVAANILETGDVLRYLTAQLTLDDVILVHEGRQTGEFILVKVAGDAFGIDAGLVAQLSRNSRTDSIQILQGVDRLLFGGDVDTEETGHGGNPEKERESGGEED